ncbi:glycosyltransferase [Lyngbya aestuarii]|uniref:glycosyltransferase n=1 Tax=Lyngbya aestuarii TaxID=118322 RepID=UPI00403DD889
MKAKDESGATNNESISDRTSIKCCWIGGARYSQPLDTTSQKKFRALNKLGELFVIGFSSNILPRQFTEHAHFYLLPQLPSPILRYVEMFVIAPIIALWLIWRHRVQVLVAQSPYEGVAATWAKKIAGYWGQKVVLVVENHVDFEEDLFWQRRLLIPNFYRFLMNQAARFTLTHADLLRAVSNSTQQQLQKWNPSKQIFKFVAWTDIEVFLQVGNQTNTSASQQIIYTGVLIPRKGVHHLINGFASISQDFPQARLVIVGREENQSYANELRVQVRELDLSNQTKFVPEISQKELAALMGQATVFVLPSLSEGLGRVVIEAMAAGKPVIASRVGGIPDMIHDGVNGFLVPPSNDRLLAKKMRWFLENPEEAQKIGYQAHVFAKSFFSTQVYVQGYQEIFESAQDLLKKRESSFESSSI